MDVLNNEHSVRVSFCGLSAAEKQNAALAMKKALTKYWHEHHSRISISWSEVDGICGNSAPDGSSRRLSQATSGSVAHVSARRRLPCWGPDCLEVSFSKKGIDYGVRV